MKILKEKITNLKAFEEWECSASDHEEAFDEVIENQKKISLELKQKESIVCFLINS